MSAARRRLGLGGLTPRLVLAGGGFLLAAVPATVLAYAATHGWAPLRGLDQGTADRLHRWAVRSPGAVSAMQWVSTLLHPWALRCVAALVVAWLLVRRQVRLALWAAVAVLGAGVLDYLLKIVVHRARPALPEAVAMAPGYSFPSGHALSSIVVFGAALLIVLPLLHGAWRVVAWAGAVACVLLVGFSRVGLGVHFVSDVVAGWLIGLGWLAVTVAAFESWRRATGRPPHDVVDVLGEGVDPNGSRMAARR